MFLVTSKMNKTTYYVLFVWGDHSRQGGVGDGGGGGGDGDGKGDGEGTLWYGSAGHGFPFWLQHH